MEKKNWNWKTHLLAASLGFFIGQHSKNTGRRQNVSGNGNFDVDKEVEALLLIVSVLKEAAKEIGDPIQKKGVDSIDGEEISREVLEEAFKKGWVDKYFFSSEDKRYYQKFMRFMVNQLKKILLSSFPTVPSYVSKDVYDASKRRIRSTISRRRERGQFYEFGDSIPKLESVLDTWRRESKPEPYTKILSFVLNEVQSS